MPKAREAARTAIRLDDTVPEAHTALALVAENYDYDWPTAEREFLRAIQLDPSYATAHQWYAEFLSWQGRQAEALAESEKARQLDPLSLIIAVDYGSVLYRARRYDDAIAQYRVVLEMDPNSIHTCDLLRGAYVRKALFTEALDIVNRCIRPRSEQWASASDAITYAEWGQTAKADQALARFADDQTPMRLQIALASGRKEQSLALLQKLYVAHSPVITNLKVDPIFDPVRSDPRFQSLLQRLHFVE